MASFTGERETSLYVIRIGRTVVIRSMTSLAGRIAERVVVVDVARLARQRNVSAGKSEAGRRVIECRSAPTRCGVAGLASCGETCGDVSGAIRVVVVRFVAAVAVGRQRRVIVVHVACGAGNADVSSR